MTTTTTTPPPAAPPRERPAREVWIMARREIVTAMGRKGFLAGTALLLAMVGYWGSCRSTPPSRSSPPNRACG